MIRKIFVIAFPQLLALLLILSTMTVRDYIKFVLGIDETNLITIVFVLYGLIIVLFQFARPYSKYALSVFIFFITLIIFTLGYSSLPERQLERAKVHYQRFDSDSSSVKHDKNYSATIDYIKREQKARQLEVEVAELRYYGPKEFYGIETWGYILFLSGIGLMFAFGIWTVSKFNENDRIKKTIPFVSNNKLKSLEEKESKEKIFISRFSVVRKLIDSVNYALFKRFVRVHSNALPKIILKDLKILPTRNTPEVILDKDGYINLKGRSIPDDALYFFKPLDNWISKYICDPADLTTVVINLEIINADSKKYILLFLQKISYVKLKHKNLLINWYYDESDLDILEIGEQLSSYLGLSFTFIRLSV